MALDESLIEELGLGLLWVRRKTSAPAPDAVEATARAATAPQVDASQAVAPDAVDTTPHADPAVAASSLQAPMPPFDASHTAAPDADAARVGRRPQSSTPPFDASRPATPDAANLAPYAEQVSRPQSSMPPFDASRPAAPDAANLAPYAEQASRPQSSMPPLDASHAAAPDAANSAPYAEQASRPQSSTPPLDASRPAAPDAADTALDAEPARAASRPQSSASPFDAARAQPEPAAASAKSSIEPPSSPDTQTFDTVPFDAYDDLPWTDDAPSPATPVAPAVPDDVHTLDWTTLANHVSGCELCRLCERRTNAVFGVGDREADWMLIGEAPGENEDKQGEPFVGQAGKLLDNMLHALGLSRESNVYIANVIKCRPPGNRNPELDEVARCEPYLQRQVELVKPKIIVALGRFAAQSLLKSEASIAALRGRVHEYRGVPVVVTYHPAYLLRSLPDKAKAWADLCLARKTHADALAALGVQPGAGKGARG